MSVNLIRRKILEATIEGESAQWVWEISLSGNPEVESGMLLPLPDLDSFLNSEVSALVGYEIPSAEIWLEERAKAFESALAGKAFAGGCVLAWQCLSSDTTEHRWVALGRTNSHAPIA